MFFSVIYFLSSFRFPIGISIAHISLLLLLTYTFLYFKFKKFLLIEVFFISFLSIKIILDYSLYEIGSEYLNTFSMLLLLFVILAALYRSQYVPSEISLNIFLFFNFLHCLFIIIQFISFNVFDSFYLLNPFGDFSSFGPDPTTNDASPYNPLKQSIHRPNGLCWEPSVAAIWSIVYCSLSVTFLNKNPIYFLHFLIAFISFFFIQSFLGLIYCLFIFIYLPYNTLRLSKELKFFLFLFFLIIVSIIIYVQQEYLFDRIYEIYRPGSSGFIRIVAPLVLLSKSFTFFGAEPLGSKAFQDFTEFLSAGRNTYSGIANTYLEVLYFLGIGGFLIFISLIKKLSKIFKSNPLIYYSIFYILLFGGYTFNPILIFTLIIFYLFAKRIHIS